MDINLPVYKEYPFDTHSSLRTAAIDIAALMFPELKHQQIHYAYHVCCLCNIAAQTRLFEFEEEHFQSCNPTLMTKLTLCPIKTVSIPWWPSMWWWDNLAQMESGNVLGPKEMHDNANLQVRLNSPIYHSACLWDVSSKRKRVLQIQNFIIPINV